MNFKNQLENKKEKAMVYTMGTNDDESIKVKIREEYEAIPINGLDLFKWCAFVGARIQNAEEIKLDKEYILEFIGCGTYIATEITKRKYEIFKIIKKLKWLDIQDKFKIVEATKQYPLFTRDDINIDDEWCQRVAGIITEKQLENVLKS